jgi:hypothetical protein
MSRQCKKIGKINRQKIIDYENKLYYDNIHDYVNNDKNRYDKFDILGSKLLYIITFTDKNNKQYIKIGETRQKLKIRLKQLENEYNIGNNKIILLAYCKGENRELEQKYLKEIKLKFEPFTPIEINGKKKRELFHFNDEILSLIKTFSEITFY